MSLERLRIATRKSPLAWRQAEHVAARLQACRPGLGVELVGMRTEGDRVLDRSLAAIGGKGLFVKELEHGLLEGRADIAVHSMKDVPATFPEGLHLPVILARESPFDAFVSNHFARVEDLPADATIGTCSLRRASQMKHRLPDCTIRELRGNVNTRLSKLDAGEFDAIILAVAGLQRLDFDGRIAAAIPSSICLPAIGQGALGIECRRDDPDVEHLVGQLDDPVTAGCVRAERAVSLGLGGSCLSPIAGYAEHTDGRIALTARVIATDGSLMLESAASGRLDDDPAALGSDVAEALRQQGADRILAETAADSA